MKYLIILFLFISTNLTAQVKEIYTQDDILYIKDMTLTSELGIRIEYQCNYELTIDVANLLGMHPAIGRQHHVFVFTISGDGVGNIQIQNQTTTIQGDSINVQLSDTFNIKPKIDHYLILDGRPYQIYKDSYGNEYLYDHVFDVILRFGYMIQSEWLDDICSGTQLRVLDGEIIMFFVHNRRLTVAYTGVFIK